MSLRRKQVFSFLLLLIFSFNTSLYGLALSGQLYLHKEAQKNSLHHRDKVLMELHIPVQTVDHYSPDFHWEKDWEFEYKGEMYDVESSRKEGAVYIFTCEHDKKEDILKRRADREAKRNQQDRDEASKKNVKVGSDFINTDIPRELVTGSTALSGAVYIHRQSEKHCELSSPPPWLV